MANELETYIPLHLVQNLPVNHMGISFPSLVHPGHYCTQVSKPSLKLDIEKRSEFSNAETEFEVIHMTKSMIIKQKTKETYPPYAG